MSCLTFVRQSTRNCFDRLAKRGVVPRIAGYLEANLRTQQLGQALGQAEIQGNVFIGEGTVIESGALIQGPVWIGATAASVTGRRFATTYYRRRLCRGPYGGSQKFNPVQRLRGASF